MHGAYVIPRMRIYISTEISGLSSHTQEHRLPLVSSRTRLMPTPTPSLMSKLSGSLHENGFFLRSEAQFVFAR